MHSKTLITNSTPTTINNHDHNLDNDQDYDHDLNTKSLNSNSSAEHDENPQILGEVAHDEIVLDHESDEFGRLPADSNPPDSFWVSHKNVTDWLNHHTFIERKTSVKMVASSRKFDSGQTRTSQRSVSFNHKPQPTIIGFRQKHAQKPVGSDVKPKQSDRQDNLRLFKNRSVPGKSSGGPVPEPRSPRVSCMGRVGSMRGRARRTGFWKKVKAVILNRVRRNGAPVKGG